MEKELTTLDALRTLLSKKDPGTQEDLRADLEKLGFEVTQSTISRSLKKLGALKTFSPTGESCYRLPEEKTLTHAQESLSDLVTDIVHNDFLIVIYTSPGSASVIARKLDYFGNEKILGTVAGDDTVFVAIPSGKSLRKIAVELKDFFGKG